MEFTYSTSLPQHIPAIVNPPPPVCGMDRCKYGSAHGPSLPEWASALPFLKAVSALLCDTGVRHLLDLTSSSIFSLPYLNPSPDKLTANICWRCRWNSHQPWV